MVDKITGSAVFSVVDKDGERRDYGSRAIIRLFDSFDPNMETGLAIDQVKIEE